MEDSVFTKIIKGEIPCYKVYEDAQTIAFLDIEPIQPGHVLVVPKAQVEFVWDLNDQDYTALQKTVKKVAYHLREKSEQPYVGELIVGTDVPHAHIHLVPFTVPSDMKRIFNEDFEPDHTSLATMAEKLRMEDEL